MITFHSTNSHKVCFVHSCVKTPVLYTCIVGFKTGIFNEHKRSRRWLRTIFTVWPPSHPPDLLLFNVQNTTLHYAIYTRSGLIFTSPFPWTHLLHVLPLTPTALLFTPISWVWQAVLSPDMARLLSLLPAYLCVWYFGRVYFKCL